MRGTKATLVMISSVCVCVCVELRNLKRPRGEAKAEQSNFADGEGSAKQSQPTECKSLPIFGRLWQCTWRAELVKTGGVAYRGLGVGGGD